jgi:cobalamin biosynthesis protein CobC
MSEPTTSSAGLQHGGWLAEAERRFGRPAAGWLDLSTGINPFAYAVPSIPAEAWQRLPDEGDIALLTAAARRYYGTTADHPMAAAPGSQALIQWLPRVVPVRLDADCAAILSPTYSEHAKCWRDGGYRVEPIDGIEQVADRHAVVVIGNPNNPDGRRTTPAALLALAERLAARGALLVVDEAFADVDPKLSVATAAGRRGLVVLRSFGKFFGLAGARLGFAFGPAELIARLTDALGPWAVGGPVLRVAAQAMNDAGWIVGMRRHLAEAATRLDAVLKANGLEVVGGTDLFRLAAHPEAGEVYNRLGRRGILVRDFHDHPAWLRFGIPPESGLPRLAAALEA